MLSKALYLAAVIIVASCGPTIVSHGDSGRLNRRLGSKHCTFGPSYWCDHIRKSAECGMTSWCISNVWQHMDLPEDTDDVCSICKEMVKEARDQLNSNETQEELKEVLEGSCNLIPLHIIAEECDKLVDDFIPELTEMLTSQMNPQVVCQTAGLCNSARVDKLLEDRSNRQAARRAPTTTCATCESKLETLKRAVTAGGQQQLLDHLLPVCRDLGSYSDACAGDLATHIGPIFEWLRQLDSEGVCLLGNACPGLFDEPPLQLESVSGPSVECDLCIHILKHWRDILVANTTKEEFKEILDGICAKTKAWAPKCTQLVDEYYMIVYDYLVNRMRAHTICKAVGLCASPAGQSPLWVTVPAGSEAAEALRPLIPLQPRPQLEAVPLAELTPASRPHSVAAKKASHPKKKLHTIKLHKSTPHAYGDDGLAHPNPLDSSVPAAAVSVPQQLPLARFGLPDLSHLFRPSSQLCDLCEFALHELQTVLEDQATEDEITAAVDGLCDRLPGTLTGQCRRFVNDYGTFVIQMLAQEIDPAQVCPLLHICPLPSSLPAEDGSPELFTDGGSSDQLSSASSEEQQEQGGDERCAICEYVMNTLLDYLKDNKTVEEIREGLDRVCEMLPSTVSRDCEEFVNTFVEEIIDMIVSGLTADEICIALKLCDPSQHSGNDVMWNSIHPVPLPAVTGDVSPAGMRFAGLTPSLAGLPVNSPRLPAEDSSDSSEEEEEEDGEGASSICILCEFVMMQLKIKLDDNSTDEKIETALKTVCSYMPASVRDDCDGFVDEYGAAILDMLKQELADPDSVCRQLQLCQPQRQTVPAGTAVAGSGGQQEGGGGRCRSCQLMVTLYAELLGQDAGTATDQLCDLAHGQLRAECGHLLATYGDWVRRQLEQHVSPGHVCIGIELCRRPRGSVHLLGGVRCLWGAE